MFQPLPDSVTTGGAQSWRWKSVFCDSYLSDVVPASLSGLHALLVNWHQSVRAPECMQCGSLWRVTLKGWIIIWIQFCHYSLLLSVSVGMVNTLTITTEIPPIPLQTQTNHWSHTSRDCRKWGACSPVSWTYFVLWPLVCEWFRSND